MPPYIQMPAICPNAPHICMPPCCPVHLYISRGYLHMIWGWGHQYTHVFGVWGHQLICLAFWHLSVHPLSQSVGCFLLDWILLDVCHASCCCTFLCCLIISQTSTTTAMTTTPQVTVVSSRMSSLTICYCDPPP